MIQLPPAPSVRGKVPSIDPVSFRASMRRDDNRLPRVTKGFRPQVGRRTVLRGLGAAALLASGSSLLAACGAGPGASDKIDVFNFGNADEGKVYDGVFSAFSAANHSVKINHTNVPVPSWADYVTKLATQTAGGNPPDFINLALEGTRLAVKHQLLEPLDSYLSGSPVNTLLKQMPKSLIDAFTVDGKLYQLPTGWQTMAIFYNPKIFAARGVPEPHPDWTWDDFLATAKALTSGDVMGFGLPWGFFQLHPWWLTNNTKAVTDDMTAPNLADPGFIEAVTFVRDLVQKHKVSPDPTSIDVYSQFAAGRYAMIGTGRYSLPAWSQSGFTSYKAVPWPKKKSHQTVIGGGGWGISPRSKNKDLDWKLMESVISTGTIHDLAKLGQQIPSVATADTPAADSARNEAQTFLNSLLNDCVPIAAPTFYNTLETVTMRHLQQIVTGQAQVEEGLAAANKEIMSSL